jgi:Ca2+-binding RTX toxin-like protein
MNNIVIATNLATATTAFWFKGDNVTATVNTGVFLVGLGNSRGVAGDHDGDILVNKGDIIGVGVASVAGVDFGGDFDVLSNQASGSVNGTVDGALLHGNGSTINNNGHISGGQSGVEIEGDHDTANNFASIDGQVNGVELGTSSNHAKLINHGSIEGKVFGVLEISQNEGGTIVNAGTITSAAIGLLAWTKFGETTLITNEAKGIISGPQDAVRSLGAISLDNHGVINGNVECFAGDASSAITNHGKIHGRVVLSAGNDVFNGKGGTSGDIFAGDGNDRIIAGDGAVAIHVGVGDNTLTSGPGADKFVFDGSIGGHVDKITNFQPGLDKVVLSEAELSGLGPHGSLAAAHFHLNVDGPSAAPEIVYVQSDGFLYYDANGHLPGEMIHFATLASHPVLHNTDFLVTA